MRRLTSSTCCALATWADFAALAFAVAGTGFTLVLALLLHGLATWLAGWIPEPSRVAPSEHVTARLARVLVFAVPLFGAFHAWATRIPSRREATSEASDLERFHEDFLEHREDPPERSPFSGDFNKDVEMAADAESFAAVLSYGTGDHKRSALKRLADLGDARSMRLLRACLTAEDQEVRLFAHAQLERIEAPLTRRLEESGRLLAITPNDPEAREAIADAHLALARSGTLDEEMSAWHLGESARIEEQVRGMRASGSESSEEESQPIDGSKDSRIREAEKALAEKDFVQLRRMAREFDIEGVEMPEWMQYVCDQMAREVKS